MNVKKLLLTLALLLWGQEAAFAQTYNYTFWVYQWCGESDNNGKPSATDSLVALNAATMLSLSGSAGKMDAGDDTLIETFIRAAPHSDGSRKDLTAHGVRFEPKDDCGGGNVLNSAAGTDISASDAQAVLQLAVGTNNTGVNDCKMEILDDCPQSGQTGYGAAMASFVLSLDNPVASPGEDGAASHTYVRKTMDLCNQFDGTNEATCESTTNNRNQYCTWNPAPANKCNGSNVTIRNCLAYQTAKGIDLP